MAAIHTRRRENMAREMLQILVVMHIFHRVINCQSTVESTGQAFVQTDKELRYMVNGEPLGIPLHTIPGKIEDTSLHDSPVSFEPPLLEFEEQPVGMPHLEKVTIQNRDTKNELHLLSISGSTLHFHCSFFQEKFVPPGGNTTFEVVFLARQVGNVENTLYIHTNVGIFKYQVFGVGIANPYRIRPILGAKVPLNTSFSPLIRLHNPHSSTLQVQEIYSSGGDLHLQLPGGEIEATKELWEIPPYDTKPIMKANFLGRIENNHTAFIRIRTNKEERDNVLVLPVEVEVSSEAGIYATMELLDFGIVRSCDEPKHLKLNLINSGVKPLHIHEIFTSPPNKAVHINFRPTHLKPDLWEPSTVATIVYNASKATSAKQWSGIVVIRTKTDNYQLNIPYQASVLHGSLSYEKNTTMFYTGQLNRTISRRIPITNHFSFTLAIHNASVPPDMTGYFSFEKFKKPVYIKSGETLSPIILKFNLNESNIHFTTELYLHTNASSFTIPIHVYNGRLKPVHHRPEIYRGQLDFGTLDMKREYSMMFTLRNENPVDIVIRDYSANMAQSKVQLLGLEMGNGTTLSQKHNVSKENVRPLLLKSNSFAVFNVSLITLEYEGTFAGEVLFYTQYENLYIPITLRTAEGGLQIKPERVVFEKCFPGKVSYLDLRALSSFEVYMALQPFVFQPNDTRFYYKAPTDEDIVLEPESDKNTDSGSCQPTVEICSDPDSKADCFVQSIGRLYFDPKLGSSGCEGDCYIGLPNYIPAGHQWLLGCMLEVETPDIDQYLFTRFRQKWAALEQQQTNVVNITIQLDTNHIRGFLFHAQAHLHWPSLRHNVSRIDFPLTQIGNTSVQRLIIQNPADVPVIMQFLPLSLYPNPQTILDMLGDSLPADLNNLLEDSYSDVFSLYDLEKYNPLNPNISTRWDRNYIEKTMGVAPHPETVALVVSGKSKIRLRVGFTPNDHLPKTSLLVIRNNLTILDTIVLHGHGGQGDIKFGNRKVGSSQPLVFEVTEKILKNCDIKRQSKTMPPNFTVKRSFAAKNSGQLPFYVQGFSINDSPCEGYGFKILDCEGFGLEPNASRKVDIAFTPDFTMSRIQRSLTLHTSLGPAINYTLQATIPAHLLTKCSAALPRPTWEPLLYYSIVCVMTFFLCCIMVAAYFEAHRIFTTDLIQTNKHRLFLPTNGSTGNLLDSSNVFNLKTISGVTGPNGNVAKANGNGNNNSKTAGAWVANGGPLNSNSVAHNPQSPTPAPIPRPHSARRRKEPSFFLLSLIKKGFSYLKFPKVSFKLLSSNKSGKGDNHGSSSTGNNTSDNKESKSDQFIKETDNISKTTLKRENSCGDGTAEEFTKLTYNKRQNKAAKQQNDPDLIADLRERERKNKCDQRDLQYDSNGNSQKNKPDHDKSQSKTQQKNYKNSSINDLSNDLEDDYLSARGNKKSKYQGNKSDSLLDNKRGSDLGDDSSSTTTDSSLDLLDDKTSSARDSTPEPQTQKISVKKNRKKNNNITSTSKIDSTHDSESAAEVYLVTSGKSKNKKIKIDPSNDFEGGSLTNVEYDLPYMMKGDQRGTGDASKLHDETMSNGLNHVMKAKGKNKRHGSKRHPLTTAPLHVDVNYEESSVIWDQPKPASLDGDLSDLSAQTELFEQQQRVVRGNAGEPAISLSGSSRSSSYSSVVGSINGDGKKSSSSPYGQQAFGDENKAPGSIIGGSKMAPGLNMGKSISPVAKGSSIHGGNTAWTNNSGSLSPQSISPGSGFGLDPITERMGMDVAPGGNLTGSPNPLAVGPSNLGLQDLQKIGLTSSGDSLIQPPQQQPGPPTMMQQLSQDRRKRQIDYQKRMRGEDWPFFNMTSPQENSFWDPTSTPIDNWTSPMPSDPAAYSQGGVGSTRNMSSLWTENPVIGGLNTSSWAPIGSAWSSGGAALPTDSAVYEAASMAPPSGGMIVGGSPNGSLEGGTGGSLSDSPSPSFVGTATTPSSSPSAVATGSFNPFNTLGNIWNPIMPASTNWGFSPPRPDEDN